MAGPAGFRVRQELMDGARLHRTLLRMAHEIVEKHPDTARTVLVGVRTRGVPLAQRLAALLKDAAGQAPPVGTLDITLYRDDLSTVAPQPGHPEDRDRVRSTDGRRAAGRRALHGPHDPRRARRAHRLRAARAHPARGAGRPRTPRAPDPRRLRRQELPTRRDEVIQVRLHETDGEDGVLLLEKDAPDTKPARKKKSGARR